MARTIACLLGLMGALLTACASTPNDTQLAWEHIPHYDLMGPIVPYYYLR